MSASKLTVDAVKNTISTAQKVTNYAQASVTLVPKLDNLPSWFDPVLADIKSTQQHANHWLTSLCPQTTKKLPLTIASFNAPFQTKSQAILDILNDLTSSGKGPTAAQKKSIATLLTEISTAISSQKVIVDAIEKDVKTFVENVNADQNKLTKDLNVIQARINNSASQISKVKATMGDHFLDSSVMGPCNVVVTMDFNITIAIDQMSLNPGLLGYIFIVQFIQFLITNVQTSQTDVEMFFDQWTMLQGQYATVQKNLKSANNDQYVAFLESLDLQEAQKSWQSLTDFVHSTIHSN